MADVLELGVQLAGDLGPVLEAVLEGQCLETLVDGPLPLIHAGHVFE